MTPLGWYLDAEQSLAHGKAPGANEEQLEQLVQVGSGLDDYLLTGSCGETERTIIVVLHRCRGDQASSSTISRSCGTTSDLEVMQLRHD